MSMKSERKFSSFLVCYPSDWLFYIRNLYVSKEETKRFSQNTNE